MKGAFIVYQSIGGEELHIEAIAMGNTIQLWMSDGRHITQMIFSRDQAQEFVDAISRAERWSQIREETDA